MHLPGEPAIRPVPPDVEHPGVTKVKQMWERGDFETIDRMVRFWEALESLGTLGNMLQRFVIWSGIVATGYLTFNGYITDWIRSIARQ